MEKIKNSFGGVIVGILLLIGGTMLLWWNEGENVKNIKTLKEITKELVTVSSDKVDSKNDGKLVLTSGSLSNNGEVLKDEEFGIEVNSSVLRRTVEVYEWVESSTTDDDKTTYTYSKEWNDSLVDSSNFHESGHSNPTTKAKDDKKLIASKVTVGAFTLSEAQKKGLSTSAKVTVSSDLFGEESEYSIVEGYVTNAKDYANPEVGDIRISWNYNDWTEATVLAVQKGSTFANYVSKENKEVNRVEKGTLTADELLLKIEKENKFTKWLFRGIGALLIIFGWAAILNPLSTLASFVPILGGLVGGVVGIVSFLLGLIQSLVVIVIAWFRFRPLLALILIVIIVIAVVALIKILGKKKKTTEPVKEAKVVE